MIQEETGQRTLQVRYHFQNAPTRGESLQSMSPASAKENKSVRLATNSLGKPKRKKKDFGKRTRVLKNE